MRSHTPLLPLLIAFAATPLHASGTTANALNRDRDPVIVRGDSLPSLVGAPPGRIVAFRWSGSWELVRLQIDERAVVDFGTVYDSLPSGITVLTYTDTATFTGGDPDPAFDADDELALRASDAGDLRSTAVEPPGTLAGTGVELAITDPIDLGVSYLYLFRDDGTLQRPAPSPVVQYQFVLLSGPYKTTYDVRSGPNPENSTVTTPVYAVHFSDRWKRNETRIFSGGATGVDILDRHKNLFGPGNCARSEDTFSAGEGAFMVNHSGPVRALRGYCGANSGPTTYRVHAFYEAREDVLTALQVHPIPGVMDYFDYSPAAAGMTWRNSLNPAGVTIDGNPDAVTAGVPEWEMVTGPQGTLVITPLLTTDIPGFTATSYYSDDSTPPATQCTGDAFEYGASGLWVQQPIPNTDPALISQYGVAYVMESTRIHVYDAPGRDTAFAAARAREARNPLFARGAPYTPPTTVAAGTSAGQRLRVAPNPVVDVARVSLSPSGSGAVEIGIYDLSGRRVTRERVPAPAAPFEREISLSALPPGLYLLRVTAGGEVVATVRIAKLR